RRRRNYALCTIAHWRDSDESCVPARLPQVAHRGIPNRNTSGSRHASRRRRLVLACGQIVSAHRTPTVFSASRHRSRYAAFLLIVSQDDKNQVFHIRLSPGPCWTRYQGSTACTPSLLHSSGI